MSEWKLLLNIKFILYFREVEIYIDTKPQHKHEIHKAINTKKVMRFRKEHTNADLFTLASLPWIHSAPASAPSRPSPVASTYALALMMYRR